MSWSVVGRCGIVMGGEFSRVQPAVLPWVPMTLTARMLLLPRGRAGVEPAMKYVTIVTVLIISILIISILIVSILLWAAAVRSVTPKLTWSQVSGARAHLCPLMLHLLTYVSNSILNCRSGWQLCAPSQPQACYQSHQSRPTCGPRLVRGCSCCWRMPCCCCCRYV